MKTIGKIFGAVRDAYEVAVFVFSKGAFGLAAVYVFVTMAGAVVLLGGAFGLAAVYVFGILAAAAMVRELA